MADRTPPRGIALKVEIRGLRKAFGVTPALDDVTLSVENGEFLAVLGPSGSGKTSLLRVLAGLDFADAGQITVGGRPMDGVPARERGVGFVFQNYALFRHMSVARNIAFGLEIRPRRTRPPSAEIRKRVASLLELMGIGELGDRYPDQISGGQRQRVALARALAIEPALLLLDEPFGALDAKVRKTLRIWLKDLHDRIGLTSIFVTHDQDEAMELADRVALLRAGRVVQFDAPQALLAEPADAFVAGFLGEATELPCTVRLGHALLPGLAPVPVALRDGPAVAVLRPHELSARRLRPGEAGNATVRSLRPAGAGLRLTLELADGVLVQADAEDAGIERGMVVQLALLRVPLVFPQAGAGSAAPRRPMQAAEAR
jgi:sulfate/thiosulfate transport system ATP-binding protein